MTETTITDPITDSSELKVGDVVYIESKGQKLFGKITSEAYWNDGDKKGDYYFIFFFKNYKTLETNERLSIYDMLGFPKKMIKKVGNLSKTMKELY